jgi:hypothetical protein
MWRSCASADAQGASAPSEGSSGITPRRCALTRGRAHAFHHWTAPDAKSFPLCQARGWRPYCGTGARRHCPTAAPFPIRGCWGDPLCLGTPQRHSRGAIPTTIAEAQAPLVFLAVGMPQQEILAGRIADRPEARGVGLCIGASIDFLTGKQHRAPTLGAKGRIRMAAPSALGSAATGSALFG